MSGAVASSARRVRPPSWAPIVLAWVAVRLALAAFTLLASYLLRIDPSLRSRDLGRWLLERLVWWDSWHYVRIAEQGYLPPGLPCCDQAFFPGYPLLMRAVSPLTGGNVVVAGLLVSLVAGAVAAVQLHRLAERRRRGAGRMAVLLLAVTPYGVFLGSVYTEALFLALALGAWLSAEHSRWWLAGLLAAGAAAVRINGLFLAVALGMVYLQQLRSQHRWRPRADVLALLAPFAAVAAYFGYLTARTGSLRAWQDAQDTGWVRGTAWPWEGLAAGWRAIESARAPDLVISRWADLLTVLGGLALVLVLVLLRRWAQAIYVGLGVAVLTSSTMIVSAPRYALLWFPGYLLLAELLVRPRWRWLRVAIPIVAVPLALALALAFSAHLWVA